MSIRRSPAPAILQTEFAAGGSGSNSRLAYLCGALDEHLRSVESAFAVQIQRRGQAFTLRGERAALQSALRVLQKLYAQADKALDAQTLTLAIAEERALGAQAVPDDAFTITLRGSHLGSKSAAQSEYLRAIAAHAVTFAIGPAGTGKTFLAAAMAASALEQGAVERLILTRPAVEAGESLGFLPGDVEAKVDPYLRPLFDALNSVLKPERVARFLEQGVIEIAPLAFMRGRTLARAFIILDEAQNTTPEQMKMFLTRIGPGSRAVITGDVTQIDLPHGNGGPRSGLVEATAILKGIEGIAVVQLSARDVMRHPLVARIVQAYEAAAEAASPAAVRRARR